jgi:4-methyl-5(b-hydroxyethyl)-thiazole monophosphate biosynthesis
MIYLFLANGFEEIEALCPLDVLRRLRLDVMTVGIGGKTVRGSHGICVTADLTEEEFRSHLNDPDGFAPDAVILPGGMPGAANLDASAVVDAAIAAASARGALIGAICAAPFLLGKRGLLAGKEATCFPGFEEQLLGARLSKHKVVRDGNLITAAGMGVALEFGLELGAALTSPADAAALRKALQAP